MANTLTVGSTVLTLPDDLLWTDEFTWSAVEQSVERSLTGALIVNAGVRTGGQPLTLKSPDDQSGWFRGVQIAQLQAWAAAPLQEMTLLFRGVSRPVMFRHQDTALEVAPVVFYTDPIPDDFYTATLRLMDATP